MNATATKIETTEEWSARVKPICEMINTCRPTSLAPFGAILSKSQMQTLRSLEGAGWLMRDADTNRYFVPSFCGRA